MIFNDSKGNFICFKGVFHYVCYINNRNKCCCSDDSHKGNGEEKGMKEVIGSKAARKISEYEYSLYCENGHV